jgi:hypothetical protein
MMRAICCHAALAICATAVLSATAAEPEKYTLCYKFQPGQTIRWEVEHRLNVRTTVSGTTQTADTLSKSVKCWRVAEVLPDGAAVFEHSVEWVDMRQKLTGCNEVRYDSRTDTEAPGGFQDVAKSVGVPLARVTIDARGKMLHRDQLKKPSSPGGQTAGAASANSQVQGEGWMTIPLPDGPVAVGHKWSVPQDIEISLEGGGIKRIKAIQQFVLESVKTGVATIAVSTDILTPITDPAVESQLVQRESKGRVRLDVDAGCVIGQQMDIDKHVVGFRGEASSIHYLNRFTEQLLPAEPRTAERTQSLMKMVSPRIIISGEEEEKLGIPAPL